MKIYCNSSRQAKAVKFDIRRVVLRLRRLYATPEIHWWLENPHPQLDGKSALDMIVARRTIEVHLIIDRLEESVYI